MAAVNVHEKWDNISLKKEVHRLYNILKEIKETLESDPDEPTKWPKPTSELCEIIWNKVKLFK